MMTLVTRRRDGAEGTVIKGELNFLILLHNRLLRTNFDQKRFLTRKREPIRVNTMTPNKGATSTTRGGKLSSEWIEVDSADEREPSTFHVGNADGEESTANRQRKPRPFQYPGKAKVDSWKAMVDSKKRM